MHCVAFYYLLSSSATKTPLSHNTDKTKEDISNTVATESQEDPQQQVETAGNGDDEALKNTPYDEQDEKKGDEDDEEEETCGFCIYMKGGGCKDAFNVSLFIFSGLSVFALSRFILFLS